MCLPLRLCYSHTFVHIVMRFTLTTFCAFCFPILTPLVGTPTYLITTNRKSFYLIVVPRRSIINVLSDDRRVFEIPKETIFLLIHLFWTSVQHEVWPADAPRARIPLPYF